jgi:hypothetical protein
MANFRGFLVMEAIRGCIGTLSGSAVVPARPPAAFEIEESDSTAGGAPKGLPTTALQQTRENCAFAEIYGIAPFPRV